MSGEAIDLNVTGTPCFKAGDKIRIRRKISGKWRHLWMPASRIETGDYIVVVPQD